jgi:hypothetical protein
MATELSSKSNSSSGVLKAIVVTGLIAGTLDITTAMIVYKVPPFPMGRFIASGAFGKDAFSGGTPMALLGILFHYIIAFSWTILFFILYPKIPLLGKNKYVTGVLYGIMVWLVMNLVILPMTNVTRGEMKLIPSLIGMVILIFMIGLPISILAHRYYSRK